MGERDIENLHIIYRQCVEWCKKYKLPFQFKVDSGNFETGIEFFFLGEAKIPQWEVIHPPRSKGWLSNPTIFCPDIIDFEHRIIIELEEEGQKRLSGSRLARKGHGPQGDMTNDRDTRRDNYYNWGKFRVLKFYEADLKEKNWEKIHSFLLDCVE